MGFDEMLAKSPRGAGRLAAGQTIRQHTAEVIRAADRLAKVTGGDQLRALGLDPDAPSPGPAGESWSARFHREIRLAALLHDLGKANDHFQEMIRLAPGGFRPQGLRHEVVSFLIARLPEFRAWIASVLPGPNSADLVLWAIAGHHRKFPPDQQPQGSGPTMRVFLSHRDFSDVLEFGASELGLPDPPKFASDLTCRLTRLGCGVFQVLADARDDAEELSRSLTGEERRFIAALKACLIGADVAGSIGRRGVQPMDEWLTQAFRRTPSVDQVEGIVWQRLNGRTPRPFQLAVAGRHERVTFARGGCGSGKTVAAYLWGARRAPGRRIYFCYPTTGTATEGFRDYLMIDPSLDAELIHGRAEIDMELLGLGEEEPELAAVDSAGALEQWSTPLVSCTVDTVLGLIQNNRRGIYAWPSIAGSACVFDEVHAYDDALFAALLRFLVDMRGIPCLLMTASLPEPRLRQIRDALARIGESLGEVSGPVELEGLKRYRRECRDTAWELVEETIGRGGKVLWVVNTVDAALHLADDPRAAHLGAILYHSRFRYVDRVARHGEVIAAFQADGPALAIATQVAEISLDLSADLLVSHLAPIPSLIQRLGRLHRRAEAESPLRSRPFLILEPDGHLPYSEEQLELARAWLAVLGDGDLSQADLIAKWIVEVGPLSDRDHRSAWLDGGFVTIPGALREASPGIDVILEADLADVSSGRRRPEEVRIPMTTPRGNDWRGWPEVAFCKVAPGDRIEYDARKGARWRR